jgi:hypothetical protein
MRAAALALGFVAVTAGCDLVFPPGSLSRDGAPGADADRDATPGADGSPDADPTTPPWCTELLPFDLRRYATIYVQTPDIPWADARDQCYVRGWELAAINSDAEADQLAAQLTGPYWIGAHDAGADSWSSLDGCPIPADTWEAGQPDGGTLEDCGYLPDTGLHDVECDGVAAIADMICEQPRPRTPECIDAAARPFDPTRYYFGPSTTNYSDARGLCEASGDHLVVFDTPEEHAQVHAMFGDEYWIGATDELVEGTWITPTGCPGYLPWSFNEPSDTAGDEDCASLNTPGELNDLQCGTLKVPLCESGVL